MSGSRDPARSDQDEPADERDERGWAELLARIEHSARATAGVADPDPAVAARLLEERARRLAVRPAPAPAEMPVELLGFSLGGRRFAVESRFVVATVRDVHPTPLPGAVAPVAAVVAWRGRVMTVLDMRSALGIPAGAPVPQQPRMLVLGGTDPELGILVDSVDTLATLAPSELHEVPEGTHARVEYLRAMAPDAVPVLDAAALLHLHAADA
ncbi:MAG TPA: chemotaxis protein CheW [Gemmatimonadaceae bacterium]|nr:chemotaxis protein CheW [Gemmatimonadaceae bacterium]